MRTVAVKWIYVVKQFERGIVERFGKYNRFVGPGLHFQIPFVEMTRIRDVREHTMDIEPPNDIKIAMHKQKTAEKYFKGNAKELKRLEITENSLKDNSKIILTEKGISPTLLLGDIPVKNVNA